jgi:hypothetical protein
VSLSAKQQEVMNNLLLEAVGKADLQHIRAYVDKGADINMMASITETVRGYSRSGSSPLYHLLTGDRFNTAISDYFLEQGVDVDCRNFNGNTSLMLAVKNGSLSQAKYYVSKGADPLASNNAGEMVLEEARKLNSWDYSSRQDIIDTLIAAMEAPVPKFTPAAEARPEPVPQQPPANPAETTRDIRAIKPFDVTPRKKSGGFNL